MAIIEHEQDFPTCANIDHAILNIQIVYCPHDSGLTMSCVLGSEGTTPWSRQLWRYGPFDTQEDVASDLASYVRVMFRRTLLEASLGYHAVEDHEP